MLTEASAGRIFQDLVSFIPEQEKEKINSTKQKKQKKISLYIWLLNCKYNFGSYDTS